MSNGASRRLATVLFTDMVGSTEIAARLGDARWRELLRRHHEILRRDLKRFGGREVDTAGDGVFAIVDGESSCTAGPFSSLRAVTAGCGIRA